MKEPSVALRLMEHLGCFDPKVPKPAHRLATAQRHMRRGEDGMRKAGGYGRGLLNWRTNKPTKGRV